MSWTKSTIISYKPAEVNVLYYGFVDSPESAQATLSCQPRTEKIKYINPEA